MLNRIILILYLIVGVINFLPIIGLMGTSRLQALYGIKFYEPNTLILMQHRAVLFAIIGGIIIYSGFQPSLRLLSTIIGLISMLSFVLIAFINGAYNAELRQVFIIDTVAAVILTLSYTVHLYIQR